MGRLGALSGTLLLHAFMDGEARHALLRDGVLRGDPLRICDPSFTSAYGWMSARMSERLKPPSEGAPAWPLWAWARWRGMPRPDPAAEEFLGQDLWMVGFEVPAEEVLLSGFEAWHYVLNGWYLPDLAVPDEGEREQEDFDASLEKAGVDWRSRLWPEPWEKARTESWSRIFDPVPEVAYVQATFWEIRAQSVVSASRVDGKRETGG